MMKSKLLKKLRKRAEANIYVVYDPSYMYRWGVEYVIYNFKDEYPIPADKERAIETCIKYRRCYILEKVSKMRKPVRIF